MTDEDVYKCCAQVIVQRLAVACDALATLGRLQDGIQVVDKWAGHGHSRTCRTFETVCTRVSGSLSRARSTSAV